MNLDFNEHADWPMPKSDIGKAISGNMRGSLWLRIWDAPGNAWDCVKAWFK